MSWEPPDQPPPHIDFFEKAMIATFVGILLMWVLAGVIVAFW